MPSISSAYRGPLIIMGLGGGFSVVGAVPVAITFSIGVKTSATVIGMGFVAFGFLLMLPGFFWCIMVRTHSFKVCWKCCRTKGKQHHMRHKSGRQKWGRSDEDEDLEEEETPALCYNQEGSHLGSPSVNNKTVARERKWPPVYVDTPSLMITGSKNYKNSIEDIQLQKLQLSCTTPTRNSNNSDSNSGDAASFTNRSGTEATALSFKERLNKKIRSPSRSPSRPTSVNVQSKSTPPSPKCEELTRTEETTEDAQRPPGVEKSQSSRF